MRQTFLSLRNLVLVSALLATACPAAAQKKPKSSDALDRPMTFELVSANPEEPEEKQQRWIAAQGKITPETSVLLLQFNQKTPIDGLTIYFDSLGGSIGGGLRLGTVLRGLNASVAIGESTPVGGPPEYGTLARHLLSPASGRCYSSCAYAFLGGRQRQIDSAAAYGVHMFWPGDQVRDLYQRSYSARDVEQAQRTSSNLAVYIQKMGIDLRLLELAATTPIADGIRRLNTREIMDLKVASIGFGTPALAGDGNWGLSVTANGATLMTGGRWSDGARRDVAYELRFSCGPSAGFDTVSYAETLRGAAETKPLALRRVLVASGNKDGVIAYSGKDGRPMPARFPRMTVIKAGERLFRAGAMMSDVLENAAKSPADGLKVLIDEGTEQHEAGEKRQVAIKSGNMPGLYGKWREACTQAAKEKTRR